MSKPRYHLQPRLIPGRLLQGLLLLILLAGLQAGSRPSPAAAQTEEAPLPQDLSTPQEITAIRTAFGIEYPVPRGPRHLAAEASDKIWYTAPDADGVGVVTVTSPPDDETIRYTTQFIGLTQGSEPYNLLYHDGNVWVTLRGGNALAQVDATTHTVQIYPLPTHNSRPTGIDRGDGNELWIAGSNGHIFKFDADTANFTEYPLPAHLRSAPRIEEILFQRARALWFTMPDANSVVTYNSVTRRFFQVPTGEPGPTGIVLDANQRPWVTASESSRVGRYSPTTVTTWVWYDTPSPNGGPVDITILEEHGIQQVWFTENSTGSASRLEIVNGFEVATTDTAQLADPPGAPWGIIRTPDNHLWIADTQRNVLYELRPPYLRKLYFATLHKNP